ncbi:MAG: CDP-alcohol phosphatidyltransferase family protein [Steroidobacteraceae bacterium]
MYPWLRQIPNLISSLRILLVIPISLALVHRQFSTAIALFAVAAVSDATDGFLAKRFGWQSTIGAILDPAADKLLLATLFVLLATLRLVPVWLTAVAVGRDIVIVLGAIAYRVCIGLVDWRPSGVSKLNTLCQVAFIMGVIAKEAVGLPPDWVVVMLGSLTFVTAVISGIDYVLRYGSSAWQKAPSRRAAPAGGSRLP